MAAVLSLCDFTGNAVAPWVEAGYRATLVDVQHPSPITGAGLVTRYGADVRTWQPAITYQFAFAFPPCTHLAVSGARWFRGKGLLALAEAIELVGVCADLLDGLGCPWMLENPISTLSTYWRQPDHMFDPCEYAGYLDDPSTEAYTKRTCLWVGGGFVMPEPRPVDPVLGSMMHLMPDSAGRANRRSATPMGFARAVFEANAALVARA